MPSLNFNITLTKRTLYTLITLGILIILAISVYAIGNIPNPGHSISELQLCSENQILQTRNEEWSCVGVLGYEKEVLKFKTIQIGSWNMDADEQKDVELGIPSKNIRSVSVMIREDNKEWRIYDLNKVNGFSKEVNGGIASIGTIGQEIILLTRTREGFFDQTLFDDSTINRGWITIGYLE